MCTYNIIIINLQYLALSYLRVIPQGTVNNNLGPDRLAGPKALDPNYRRLPTLFLEVLTVHGA